MVLFDPATPRGPGRTSYVKILVLSILVPRSLFWTPDWTAFNPVPGSNPGPLFILDRGRDQNDRATFWAFWLNGTFAMQIERKLKHRNGDDQNGDCLLIRPFILHVVYYMYMYM